MSRGTPASPTRPAGAVTCVTIPPLDSLTHDTAYFTAITHAKLHGGLLDGLRHYYTR